MRQNPNDQDEKKEQLHKPSTERLQIPDGPGGILSDSDRRFLLHDHPDFPELEWEGNETQKRWRIREKIKTAFQDFQLLNELDRKDKSLIFDDFIEDNYLPDLLDDLDDTIKQEIKDPTNDSSNSISTYNESALGPQYYHFQEVIMFLYTACDIFPGPSFEQLIQDAIERYVKNNTDASDTDKIANIEVDATIEIEVSELPDIEKLETKLERGEELTREEIGELFLQGRIEPGDLSADDIPNGY